MEIPKFFTQEYLDNHGWTLEEALAKTPSVLVPNKKENDNEQQ